MGPVESGRDASDARERRHEDDEDERVDDLASGPDELESAGVVPDPFHSADWGGRLGSTVEEDGEEVGDEGGVEARALDGVYDASDLPESELVAEVVLAREEVGGVAEDVEVGLQGRRR